MTVGMRQDSYRKVKTVAGWGFLSSQQKERLLPINLGLYFLSLIILFSTSPCTSCLTVGTKEKKIPGICKSLDVICFLLHWNTLWNQVWVLLDRSEEGSAACAPAGEGEKKMIWDVTYQVYCGMRWLNLNTAKLRDYENTKSNSAHLINLTLEIVLPFRAIIGSHQPNWNVP